VIVLLKFYSKLQKMSERESKDDENSSKDESPPSGGAGGGGRGQGWAKGMKMTYVKRTSAEASIAALLPKMRLRKRTVAAEAEVEAASSATEDVEDDEAAGPPASQTAPASEDEDVGHEPELKKRKKVRS
jgi:hypothetical protein